MRLAKYQVDQLKFNSFLLALRMADRLEQALSRIEDNKILYVGKKRESTNAK